VLWSDLPLLMVIFFIASGIQGASGVGFGLFSVAALSLMAPLAKSTPILAIVNTPVVLYVFARLWRHAAWGRLAPIITGLLLGVPVGILFLVKLPDASMLRSLGIVLVLASVNLLRPRREATTRPESHGLLSVLGRLAVGFAVGGLAGAYNVGGPPIVAYVYAHPWTKEQRVATMQAVFVVSLGVRIVAMAVARMYSVQSLLISAACLPAAGLGMALGYAVFARIPTRWLEIAAAVFLLISGVKLLVNP
jgi:uncharacterized protein